MSTSNAAEKKDCKELKKFSKEYMTCLAENIKSITLKAADKVKKDTSIAADEVKEDTSKAADKVKKKTEKIIKKSKDALN